MLQDEHEFAPDVLPGADAYPETDVWSDRAVERGGRLDLTGAIRTRERDRRLTVNFYCETSASGRPRLVEKLPINSFRLPFIDAVQDPSRIRWRYGAIDSETAPPIVLENLPVCGNCHSFSGDGSVLGLDVDYGNDKGGYAVLPVEEQMVMNDEKI